MTLTVTGDVVWTDVDDEVRLYDADKGEFRTLNASAAEIWRLVVRGLGVDDIVADLTARFSGGDEHEERMIRRDVLEFIEALRATGLVEDPGDE